MIYDSGAEVCVSPEAEFEEWILKMADYDKEKVNRSGFKGMVGDFIEALEDLDSDEMHELLNISQSVKIDLNMVKTNVVSWEKDSDIKNYIDVEIRKQEL